MTLGLVFGVLDVKTRRGSGARGLIGVGLRVWQENPGFPEFGSTMGSFAAESGSTTLGRKRGSLARGSMLSASEALGPGCQPAKREGGEGSARCLGRLGRLQAG